ncbi:hypothetical protein AB0M45_32175 [Nocardia sp. NPDC051787]|uniref:hypothetical protein n=1 Tax=Nocardia sp. NPDC051787 TaxID=3155415 RepID=UPI00344A72F3
MLRVPLPRYTVSSPSKVTSTASRVDTIEQAIVRSGLAEHPVGPAGNAVGYAVTREHLRQGLTVIAESVNLLSITRDSGLGAARDAGVAAVEIEVICSDPAEHRHRVVSRLVDIPALPLRGSPWRSRVGPAEVGASASRASRNQPLLDRRIGRSRTGIDREQYGRRRMGSHAGWPSLQRPDQQYQRSRSPAEALE